MPIAAQNLDKLLVQRLVGLGPGKVAFRDAVEEVEVGGRILGGCCFPGLSEPQISLVNGSSWYLQQLNEIRRRGERCLQRNIDRG